MSEAKITKQCRDLFKETKKKYPDFFYQKFSDRFTSSIPDYYLLYKSVSVWLELKDKGKTPTKLQHYTLDELSKGGAIAFWTDDFSEVIKAVNFLIKV